MESRPSWSFIDRVSLEPDEERDSAGEEKVSLMTIHSAKGLEFPAVFLVGVNEDLLPHRKSSNTLKGREEERRLFYVAVTRAEKMLCLSCCSPSHFLSDVPYEHTVYIEYGGYAYENFSSEEILKVENTETRFTPGHKVSHEFFGRGVVRKVKNTGRDVRVGVVFPNFGGKSIVAVFPFTSDLLSFPLRKVEEGTNVNTGSKNKSTALHDCSLRGDLKTASSLVNQGADLNAQDEDGNTPLHFASLEGAMGLVSFLIEKGVQVNAKNKNGDTPLHFASRMGKTKIASLLVEKGADVNAQDEDGDTPLHDALSQGVTQLASLLIEKGAEVNTKNKDGRTPLHFNSLEELAKAAPLLVRQKETDVNAKD